MSGPLLKIILRRIGQTIITLLLMTFFVYLAMSLFPGEPLRGLFGFRRPQPEVLQALQEQFRYDKPLIVQWALYVRDMATGEWGHTFPGSGWQTTLGPPVRDVVMGSLGPSLAILVPAIVIQAIGGTVAGAVMVSGKGRVRPAAAYALAVLLLGIPVLALAYFLQALFGWQLGWLPVRGVHQGWISYALPVISLSLTATALVALLTRSQLQEVLGEPYIRAARGRSLPGRRIVGIHALRVAVMPTITFIASNFGQLLTGLIIVEGIYGIPGVGGVIFRAVQNGERILLITMLVLITAAVSLVSLLADIAYTVVDPRLRDSS